ncbi:CHAT domain-containing tetratricopeptide repeat protein [Reichenbachiella sp.]|uniref:CHAT domain-containing protein n=4 Tax=Reichenbachiella sp. TaxID=2184521 RepID=UPI003262EDF8
MYVAVLKQRNQPMIYLKRSLITGILCLFVLISVQSQNTPTLNEAQRIKHQAEVLYNNSKLDSAILKWQAAAELFLSSKKYSQYVHCINEVGSTQSELGRFESAESTLENILMIGKNHLGDTAREVGKSYYYLASCQGFKGNYEPALVNLKSALVIARENKKDRTDEAVVLNGLGRINFFLSNYNEALDYFGQSLDILRAHDGDYNQIAGGYINMGSINLMKGHYGNAVAYYEKALQYIPEDLENQHKAGVYNNLGYAYFEQGELESALLYYLKSLTMRRSLLDANHPAIASSLVNVGNIHYRQGAPDLALQYYQQALDIRKETLKADHPEIGQNLMNIGMMHDLLADYPKAEMYLKEAISNLIIGAGAGHQFVGDAYLNLGSTYRKQNKSVLADSVFQLALEIFVSKQSTKDIISIHLERARLMEKDPQMALNYTEIALAALFPEWETMKGGEILTQISPSNCHDLLKIYKEMAGAYENIYVLNNGIEQLENALAIRKLSVRLLDMMRLNYRSDISKMYNDELNRIIYEKGVSDALQLGIIKKEATYNEEAFWFIEKGKASVLHTNLVESKANKIGGVDPGLLERLHSNKKQLTYLENELISVDSMHQTPIREKIFELVRGFDALKDSVRMAFPDYHQLTQQIDVPTVRDIQNTLAPDEAVLEYFIGESELTIALVTQNRFELELIPDVESIKSNVKSIYRAINKRDKGRFRELSMALYSNLLEPVRGHLADINELKIIPHADLWYLPFESLITNDTNDDKLADASYLIADFVISYHYSSTLLTGHQRVIDSDNQSLLAFAPVFKSSAINRIEDSLRYSSFYEKSNSHDYLDVLPESELEVAKIARVFESNGQRASVFLHKLSTEEKFKLNARNYSFVHLATHSFIDEEKPNYSGIYFSKPDSLAIHNEDGILFAGELYNLNLNSDLVVLSSCESGIGKLNRGEGMLSLSRGFYYSGAKQVLYSLWKVYDKSTSELMVSFYDHLLNGSPTASALRKAKLEMLKSKTSSFPKNWAGFVLLGN